MVVRVSPDDAEAEAESADDKHRHRHHKKRHRPHRVDDDDLALIYENTGLRLERKVDIDADVDSDEDAAGPAQRRQRLRKITKLNSEMHVAGYATAMVVAGCALRSSIAFVCWCALRPQPHGGHSSRTCARRGRNGR